MKTVKYIRVSTKDQSTLRQETDEHKQYIDVCSGKIAFKDRKEGKKLFKEAAAGNIKTINAYWSEECSENQITDNIINFYKDKGVESLGENSRTGYNLEIPEGYDGPNKGNFLPKIDPKLDPSEFHGFSMNLNSALKNAHEMLEKMNRVKE